MLEKIIWTLLVLIAFTILYVLFLRNWLKEQPWAKGFFAWIEPYEIALWRKSETILWARFLIVLGLIPPILEQLGDLSGSGIERLLPEKYQALWTLSFTVIGIVNEFLRRSTTKPLEIVELPQNLPPAVAQAVNRAEVAKDAAVAVVEKTEQKASGGQ